MQNRAIRLKESGRFGGLLPFGGTRERLRSSGGSDETRTRGRPRDRALVESKMEFAPILPHFREPALDLTAL